MAGRLIDRLLNNLKLEPPDHVFASHRAMERWRTVISKLALPAMAQAQIFVVDNVAKYFYQEPSMCKTWRVTEDFPNVAPPYPIMWMENKEPSWLWESAGKSITPGLTRDPEMLADYTKSEKVRVDTGGELRASGVLVLSEEHEKGSEDYAKHGRWTSTYLPFTEYSDGKSALACFGGMSLDINDQGQILGIQALGYFEDEIRRDVDPDSMGFHSVQLHCIPYLLSIMFMHCKNVPQVDNTPSRALNKKWQRRGNKPLVRYKTLEIEQITRFLAVQGKIGSRGVRFALHTCRGHFKTFEDKGLFGKYKGMYWWHDQTRGKMKEGFVEKEYSLHGSAKINQPEPYVVAGEPAKAAPSTPKRSNPGKLRKPELKSIGGAIGRLLENQG